MIKDDKTFKSIFIKVGSAFLLLYIIIISVFIIICFRNMLKQNQEEFLGMNKFIETQVTKEIFQYKYDNNNKKEVKTNENVINMHTNLNKDLSFFSSGYSKVFLYDKNNNLVAKSGIYADVASCKKKNSDTVGSVYLHGYRYIDLEKCLTNYELSQLYNLIMPNTQNNNITYGIKGEGYINGSEVIPKKWMFQKLPLMRTLLEERLRK